MGRGRTLRIIITAIFAVLAPLPIAAQTTATATALATSLGAITNVQVVQGGSGYVDVPLVTFTGGGHGASGIANLSEGVVQSITLVTAGTGYTNPVIVTVAAPGDTLDLGLIGLYPFDGSAADLSGLGNAGTLFGRKQFVADRFGNPAGALSFNGNGDYVMTAKSLPDLASASVSCWVMLDGWFGYQSVFFEGDNTPGKDFTCYFAGSPVFYVRTDNGASASAWMPPVGAWTHFVTVADAFSQKLEFWANGQLLAAGPFAPGTLGATKGYHSNLFFGARAGTMDWFLDGSLDDVRIYGRALTHAEVQALYARELGRPAEVGISIASVAVTLKLQPGTTNQLQGSSDLVGWVPLGAPFLATNSVVNQTVPTSNGVSFFRVVQAP